MSADLLLIGSSDSQLDPGMACDPQDDVAMNEVVGRIVTLPAPFATGSGRVTEDAAFLQIIRLVR